MNTQPFIPDEQPRGGKSHFWGTVLKLVAALATALASALGLQSCL